MTLLHWVAYVCGCCNHLVTAWSSNYFSAQYMGGVQHKYVLLIRNKHERKPQCPGFRIP